MTALVDAPRGVDTPTRADGVELIGAMVGSGYRTPPALVRRRDGQVLQLTPLLYLVLKATDGHRTSDEIAEVVGRALSRSVTADDVRTLLDSRLRPLGLVRRSDGTDTPLKRTDPLLGLKPRFAVTRPRTTRLLTAPFQVLFRPLIATAVVVAFALIVAWVFFERGLAASAYDAFERPHLLLLVFAVSVLSGGFHEFGHAAAARYGGARPGAMGAGLYLVWPAFYTDVTDSYRLGRAGRIRTDLGGLYFNAVVVVLTFAWWWWSGWEALLLLVATQVLQMTQQLLPLLRFDGYHLLADLAGVPDLYQRIKPTLVGLLPHRWNHPENRLLKPWARAVITFWVLVTVPMMALMVLTMIGVVPRLIGTVGAVVSADAAAVADAARAGNALDVAAHSLQVLAVVVPTAGCALILARLGVRWFGGLTRWGRGSLVRRGVSAVLSAVMLSALSIAWWPHPGTYRPIQPDEEGTLTAVLEDDSSTLPPADSMPRPPVGDLARTAAPPAGRPLVAPFPKERELPTKEDPVLALVLTPADGGTDEPSQPGWNGDTDDGGADAGGTDAVPADTWVFPFDAPLPPEEGDNQALAVADTDGAVAYDVAFALVWADGNEVLNVNEAHAYASCSDCIAVAVAFQVVLVMNDAQVVVPQNLAGAAAYECYRCITAAIASQLVLSVDGEPGDAQLMALADVWDRLLEFAHTMTSYSITEIVAQLDEFKAEIVAILAEAPPAEPTTSPSPTAPTEVATTDPPATLTPTEESPLPSAPAPTDEATTEPTSPPTTTEPEPSPSPTESEPSPTTEPSP